MDYKKFSENVLYNMDVHEEEDKNFQITPESSSITQIVDILKEEAETGQVKALKIVAFLHLHGVVLEKNEARAKALFLRAA